MGDASGSARSSPARLPSGSDDQDGRRDRRSRGAAAGAGRPRHRAQASRAGGGFRDDSRPHRRPDRRRSTERRARRRRPRHGAATRRARSPAEVVYLDPAPRAAFDTRDEPRAPHGSAQRDVRPARAGDRRRARRSTSPTTTAPTTTSSRSRRPSRSTSAAMRPAGPSRSASTEPGIVRVFCEIHSHMNAFILVFAHRYFAVTDDEGRYQHRQRAARHLHGHRLERDRPWRPAQAIDHRCPKAAATSTPISASDERAVFVAHATASSWPRALLAVLSIGVAIYLVNVARHARRRKTSCSVGSTRLAALVDRLPHDRARDISRTMARLIADLPKLKAAVDTNDPPTVQDDRRGLPERAEGRPLHRHATAAGGARAPRRSRGRRRGAAGHAVRSQRAAGRERSPRSGPQADGILQVVIGADRHRIGAEIARHLQRRRQPRRRGWRSSSRS